MGNISLIIQNGEGHQCPNFPDRHFYNNNGSILKEYKIGMFDIQCKSMLALCTRGHNSQGDPAGQYES